MIDLDDSQNDFQALVETRYLSEWRAARKDQVSAAVAIINPPARLRHGCREDVERFSMRLVYGVAWMRARDLRFTKDGKLAAARLAAALRRLKVVLADPALDGIVAAAAVTRHITSEEIADGIGFCEELSRTGTGKLTRKNAEAKRLAVNAARALVMKYRPGEANNAAKGSALCRLAALLYGDVSLDLHHQCLAALRKVREKQG